MSPVAGAGAGRRAAKCSRVIATIGLIVIVSGCALVHAFGWLLGALRIDAREALLYLGLAELDLGTRGRARSRASRGRPATPPRW